MEERCVYVKESVLSELEREKRGLKWQLARTTKLAETRAADVAACEAKVKDLLTILELNKSVADRAVRRTYTHESQLHRVAAERDDLQLRLAAQRIRLLERGVRGLTQRIERRRRREALQTLMSRTTWRRRVRTLVRRMAHLLTRSRLASALQQWQSVCARNSARVHPMSATAASAALHEHFPTEYLFDECFRLRFKRRLERKRASFFAWKVQWGLGANRERVAACWFRTQLSRRVMWAWRRRLRCRKQLQAALESVVARRTRRVFCVWSGVVQRRRALDRLLRSLATKLLRRTLTRLRLRCIERSSLEWAQVLKTAHLALEEEKARNALYQDAALRDIHAAYAAQEDSKHSFQEIHSRALLLVKHHARLHQCFAAWSSHLTRRKLLASVAAHFHNVHHRPRLRRRHFAAWMRFSASRSRGRRCLASAALGHQRTCLSRVFRSFAVHVQREAAKKRRLRALVSRVHHVRLLRSWSRWQQTLLLDEHHATAQLETHELVQNMQLQQLRWQRALARSEKLHQQLQLQCALRLRDARLERQLRERFHRWSSRSRAAKLRRVALKRMLARRCTRALRLGVALWRQRAVERGTLARELDARAARRQRQHLVTRFASWRHVVSSRALLRWNLQRKCLYFALWRAFQARKQERAVALCRFLQHRVAVGWRALALRQWRRSSEEISRSEQRRDRLRRERVERVWRRWTAYAIQRLRLRRRQREQIQSRLREQRRLADLRAVFWCWKLLCRREKRQLALASLAATRLETRRSCHKQRLVLDKWRQLARCSSQRQRLLLRVLHRLVVRTVRTKWTRWTRAAAAASQTLLLRERLIARTEAAVKLLSSRYLLGTIFQCWREFVRSTRWRRERLVRRRRALLLRQSFHAWRRDFVDHHRALKAALRRRLHRTRTLLLSGAFKRWERAVTLHAVCLQSTVSQILVDRAQERADELVGALLASRSMRSLFSAWTRVVQSRKARRRALQRVVRAWTSRLQRSARTRWRASVDTQRRLEQLVHVLQKQHLRVAWRRLRAELIARERRARAAIAIGRVWHRSCLRFEWNVWKRRDRLEVVKRSHRQSLALVKSVVEAMAGRRHDRTCQRSCFSTWKQQTARAKRVRGFWGRVLGQHSETLLRASFQHWRVSAGRSLARRTLLTRIVSRRHHAATRAAFHHWKYEAIQDAFVARLEEKRRELERHRAAVAKHVAMEMYMSWKRPCLSSCFTKWCVCTRDAKRSVEDTLARWFARKHTRLMSSVMCVWRQLMRMKLLWTNAVAHSSRRMLSTSFAMWKADVAAKQALGRMLSTLRRWHLRRGFKQLHARHHERQRRASLLIVLTAQNALQQRTQQHLRKSVALLLTRKQTKALAHAFSLWRCVVTAKQRLRACISATSQRFQLRSLRRMLRAWRCAVQRHLSTRRRVRRLRVVWSDRRVSACWSAWRSFASRSQQTKLLVYEAMIRQRAQAAVHGAWRTWTSFVRSTNAEIQQQQAAAMEEASRQQQRETRSLELRHEHLLLESVQLQQRLQALRESSLRQFANTLAAVLASSSAGPFARTARAFAAWRQRGRSARVLASAFDSRRLALTTAAFSKWQSATAALRSAADLAQHQTTAMEKVLLVFSASGAQTKKRKVVLLWKARTLQQRAKKTRARLLLMAKRTSDKLIMRCCFVSWKVFAARTRAQADAMQVRAERGTLQLVFSRWCRWCMARRRLQSGVRVIAHVIGGCHRRLMARSWVRWRAHSADAVVTVTHAKLVVLELERWNASCRHRLDQLAARVLANWKCLTRTARAGRCARALAFQEMQRGLLRRRCFLAWRNQLPARQRVLHPVLCIQTSLRRQKTAGGDGRLLFCAYNEYRRKLQSKWRLSTTRSALRKRVVRACALSLLLRALRRRHLHALRRALWIWFASVQRVSTALAAIRFRALPWRAPRTNFAGSMLLLALEEMHHLRQAFSIEQRIKSLQIVELIGHGLRRQHLRRAFDRLQHATASLCRRASSALSGGRGRAAARAFVGKAVSALLRRGFRVWKEQYIDDALQRAEAAQRELLQALQAAASYRQTLDPYAMPY